MASQYLHMIAIAEHAQRDVGELRKASEEDTPAHVVPW